MNRTDLVAPHAALEGQAEPDQRVGDVALPRRRTRVRGPIGVDCQLMEPAGGRGARSGLAEAGIHLLGAQAEEVGHLLDDDVVHQGGDLPGIAAAGLRNAAPPRD